MPSSALGLWDRGGMGVSECPQDPPPSPVLTLPPYPAPQAGVWRSWRRPRM